MRATGSMRADSMPGDLRCEEKSQTGRILHSRSRLALLFDSLHLWYAPAITAPK